MEGTEEQFWTKITLLSSNNFFPWVIRRAKSHFLQVRETDFWRPKLPAIAVKTKGERKSEAILATDSVSPLCPALYHSLKLPRNRNFTFSQQAKRVRHLQAGITRDSIKKKKIPSHPFAKKRDIFCNFTLREILNYRITYFRLTLYSD